MTSLGLVFVTSATQLADVGCTEKMCKKRPGMAD